MNLRKRTLLRILCKEHKLPISGNKATLLERLRRPEQLRDTYAAAAKQVSPVKSDGRAEEVSDREDGLVEEEPYQLDVVCNRLGKHDKYLCCCEIQGSEFPIPPPQRVHHPGVGIGHLLSYEADSIGYKFSFQGMMHHIECFAR
jgi:hypothetical protein